MLLTGQGVASLPALLAHLPGLLTLKLIKVTGCHEGTGPLLLLRHYQQQEAGRVPFQTLDVSHNGLTNKQRRPLFAVWKDLQMKTDCLIVGGGASIPNNQDHS